MARNKNGVETNKRRENSVPVAKPLEHASSNTTNVSAVADRELRSKRQYDTVDDKLAAMHIERNMKVGLFVK